MQIGAQLYTINKHLKNLEDFSASLKKVADIGYKVVQVSGTCEFEPKWLKEELDKNDLKCVITHIEPEDLIDNAQKVVEEHKIFGCTHIGIGGMPTEMRGSLEGYNEFKKLYLPVAEKLRDLGAKFMYHNHWFEFDKLNGKNVIERILEDFPEDSIDFTLDLGWAAFANADVVELIDKLNGRLSIIHLKDYKDVPEGKEMPFDVYLRPIYEGKLPYDDYINALKKVNCEYALVEQDWTYDECPFECLKRSYENVTKRFPELI